MPYADPEKQRAAVREAVQRHRAKVREAKAQRAAEMERRMNGRRKREEPRAVELAEQVSNLVLRLREVSRQIGGAELRASFPPRLVTNLDIGLADAARFISEMDAAHRSRS